MILKLYTSVFVKNQVLLYVFISSIRIYPEEMERYICCICVMILKLYTNVFVKHVLLYVHTSTQLSSGNEMIYVLHPLALHLLHWRTL